MKTRHKPTTTEHRQNVKALQERLTNFRLPGGTFNYTERAAAVAETHGYYNAAFQLVKHNPHDADLAELHLRAIKLWHQTVEAAYPPGFWDDYARLRQGESAGLEGFISFLESDPMFYRTGYIKAWLIRYIKPAMLTPDYVARLQSTVLHVVDTRDDRDFRAFCRLARKVDGPELRGQLTLRLTRSDLDIRRRARWVLEALAQKDTMR